MPRIASDPPSPVVHDIADAVHDISICFQECECEECDARLETDPEAEPDGNWLAACHHPDCSFLVEASKDRFDALYQFAEQHEHDPQVGIGVDELLDQPPKVAPASPASSPATGTADTRPCESCGATDTACERPVPLRTVACDQCWEQAVSFPEREPAPPPVALLLEQIDGGITDPREGTATTCTHCGAACSWHRTVNGRWLLMEPGGYPTAKIPPGKRWRIAGDGTAVNLGRANPVDHCRISHFDICPSKPAPTDGAFLLALWRQHRKRDDHT